MIIFVWLYARGSTPCPPMPMHKYVSIAARKLTGAHYIYIAHADAVYTALVDVK